MYVSGWRTSWAGLATAVVVAALVAGPGVRAAAALEDGQQLLTGGNSGSGASTRFTAPGLGNLYGVDFPGTGLGEAAAQIRMTAGVVSKLRVSIVTEGTQDSGTVTAMVRLNGANTELTCSVGIAGGDCGSGGKSFAVLNGDQMAVRIVSTYNEGAWTFTYSLLYD